MLRPKSSQFDKLLEKATSQLLLDPDWNTILAICDLIRQADCIPKYAVMGIKKKIYSPNPHVSMFGLLVLESCMKNCGSPIHEEIATKQVMEELKEFVKSTPHENAKSKVLELIQTWAHAFRKMSKYRAVQDTLNIMKAEGYKFPVLRESDEMFVADTAPEWADGECCHRCRVQFGMVQRKHHCRACGQVFCSKCTSKQSTIPKFGIEKEVRVCEACYDSINKPTSAIGSTPSTTILKPKQQSSESELPSEYLASSLSQQPQVPPTKTEEELREEEEFNLALAISKSEAEEKEKEKLRATNAILSNIKARTCSPPLETHHTNTPESVADDNMDPELERYLNRSYWEQKHTGGQPKQTSSPTQPSAPVSMHNDIKPTISTNTEKFSQNGLMDEIDEFVSTLRSQLEIFVTRMKSSSSRGRSIANDSSIQTLFMNITALHSQLLKYIQMQDDSRAYLERLQDQMAQSRDARAALEALKEEHKDRLLREAEEAERLRHIQMAQKLDLMRKKKQEYYEMQRQITMHRMQEQEHEMQLRHEQQKQQYLRGQHIPVQMSYPQMPYVSQPGGPNFPPSSLSDGSPMHLSYQPPMQDMQRFPPSMPPGPTYHPGMPIHPGMHPAMLPGQLPMSVSMAPPPQSFQQGPPPQIQPQQVPPSQQGLPPSANSQQPNPTPMMMQGMLPSTSMPPPPNNQPPPQQEQKMAELISFD